MSSYNTKHPCTNSQLALINDETSANLKKVDSSRRGSRSSNLTNTVFGELESRSSEDVWLPHSTEVNEKSFGVDFELIRKFVTEELKENNNPLLTNSVSDSIHYRDVAGAKTVLPTKNKLANIFESRKLKAHDFLNKKRKKEASGSLTETPIYGSDHTDTFSVKFGEIKLQNEAPPDRFSFFSSTSSDETLHAPNFASLFAENDRSVEDLFNDAQNSSPWWLDCSCPTDEEIKMVTKAFNIHPLTSEDIRMQETREKFEMFKDYYFVCIQSFNTDESDNEEFLQPINVYIIVFKKFVLSFHFTPIPHCANVRRRVRQLIGYIQINTDWLCYALIDEIIDSFAPFIKEVEYDSDLVEDSVFLSISTSDFSNMLRKVGEARRKSMTLMRLLANKADVIKMFAKRCEQDLADNNVHITANIEKTQPRSEIALYLGDIQDHVITMYQNLMSHEKILSRSHSNYLAQLQVESFNSNNLVTDMLSKATLIGTMFLPLNIVTGLFGMNVLVPGKNTNNLHWFWGIIGCMGLSVILCLYFGNLWLKKYTDSSSSISDPENAAQSIKLSIRNLGFRRAKLAGRKSSVSFTSRYNIFEV